MSTTKEPKQMTMESSVESKPVAFQVDGEPKSGLEGDHHQGRHPHAAHLYREDNQGHVIERLLIPRPTNDPKDPLTWAIWRKHTAMASVSFFVFLSNYTLSALAPGLVAISVEFDLNGTQGSYLITLMILILGLGNLFWIPLSLKIGKRPVLIMSSGIFFVSTIWSAVAKSYGSLLASRIVAGFGASASEAMGPAIVADLYFLHERATLTSLYTFMIGGGSAIGGIFGGLVMNGSGDWRWINWMGAILTGTAFLLTCLFQQETNFRRPADTEMGENLDTSSNAIIQTSYSFKRAFSVTEWYDRETPLWRYLWRPLPLLLYPAVLWGAVVYGVTLGWVVVQQTANAIYFPALYNFSSLGVGNIFIASLIGAVIGCLYAGPGSDWFVAVISKRKDGVFLPEYRLWLMIGPAIFGPVGLALWGCGLGNVLHWSVAAAGSGISYGVLCAVPNIGMTYVVDGYREVAGEAMTTLTAFKNTFAFGISFAVIPWILKSGFAAVGGYEILIEGFFFLLTIPLYIWGERLREWTKTFAI